MHKKQKNKDVQLFFIFLSEIGNFPNDFFKDRSMCAWWALCSAGAGQPLTSVMKSKVTHACQSFPKTHGNEICETGNHLLKFSIRLKRCIISLSAVERSNICHLFKHGNESWHECLFSFFKTCHKCWNTLLGLKKNKCLIVRL